MKKIIAAALSILLGSIGYTVVDKTLEKRVENLEISLSSVVEENGKPEESSATETPTVIRTNTTCKTDSLIPDYVHALLKVKLPDYGGLEAYLSCTGDNWIISGSGANVYLDGSEISVLVHFNPLFALYSNAITINLELPSNRAEVYYKLMTCNISCKNNKLYVSNVKYYDTSEITTTTTTRKAVFFPEIISEDQN